MISTVKTPGCSFVLGCLIAIGISMQGIAQVIVPKAVSNDLYIARLAHVPVLCYHQVRDWQTNDSKTARTFIMPVATFRKQMQMLHDSGYHTILPDQLVAFVWSGIQLPKKPVLLTFDDGTASQYDNALPELNKYGFKAVFFIMTVVLNKKNFFTVGTGKGTSKRRAHHRLSYVGPS